MMKRILWFLLVLTASPVTAQTLPSMNDLNAGDAMASLEGAAGGSMSSLLQGQLGLTEDQASGSIGSLLSLAGEKLGAGDFDELAGMIPGADKYLESARSLGAVTEPLKSLGDLNQSLAALGITPETIEKFVPMVTEYLGKLGGEDAKALLAQVLG
jgi:hypothetical protein